MNLKDAPRMPATAAEFQNRFFGSVLGFIGLGILRYDKEIRRW
jgi:hypothetical protein